MSVGDVPERVGDVVEPIARVVGRQEDVDLHLARQIVERQQIAGRVLVFRAIQPVKRRTDARVRACRRDAIELRFEPARHRDRRSPRQAAAARPVASLRYAAWRRPSPRVCWWAPMSCRSTPSSASDPVLNRCVVTADAVALQHLLDSPVAARRRRRRRGCLRGRLGLQIHRRGEHRSGGDERQHGR